MQFETLIYVLGIQEYQLWVINESCSFFVLTTQTALECRTRAALPQNLQASDNMLTSNGT
jgi:hypothetical protein